MAWILADCIALPPGEIEYGEWRRERREHEDMD